MQKKSAMLFMGEAYTPDVHRADWSFGGRLQYIRTARDFAEAEALVAALYADGLGALELCGAFSKEQALRLREITEKNVAIGFAQHLPEDEGLFAAFYGD
ncbi:DUF6506 family protein [Oscillospiraceae bacterium OttesenSCG-928-F05]|nr:DUF6506 family protein [Oscillospiraceae bacterium OttesenSCG-928-F05]